MISEKLKEAYRSVSQRLCPRGFQVGPYKEISYGIQFSVSAEEKKGLIRLYDGKKGLKRDLSQMKDPEFARQIERLLSGENCGSEDLPAKGEQEIMAGSDESGKGDFFGPLVVSSVYLPSMDVLQELVALGIKDSKAVSANNISLLSKEIRKLCPFATAVLRNKQYNDTYPLFQNLNTMLGEIHAKTALKLLEETHADSILFDQFGRSDTIKNAFHKIAPDCPVHIFQRPKAESHPAVAAASIVARDTFVREMKKMEEQFQMEFPLGAGQGVIEAGKVFIEKYGKDRLREVAKLHFKTAESL